MQLARLTKEQWETFDRDGMLIVRNALDDAFLERLTEAGDHIASDFLAQTDNKYLQERRDILHQDAIFDLVAHSPTVPLVIQLLSPNLHLQSAAIIYKHPEAPGTPPAAKGWHRDIGITSDLGHDKLPLVGIKVAHCLTDFRAPNSGFTTYVPGSHRRPKPIGIRNSEYAPPGAKDLILNRGDVVLAENRVYHSATLNLSDRTSKVVMFGYSYRWMKPDENLDPPDQRLLDKADPITRQLLGGYSAVETVPRTLLDWAAENSVCLERIPWVVDADSGDPVEIIPRY